MNKEDVELLKRILEFINQVPNRKYRDSYQLGSELNKLIKDLITKCPFCGETENFHYNHDYSEKNCPVIDILCNQCGETFKTN